VAAKLKLGLVAIACTGLILSDIRFSADAHGVHRPRIGASHKTPSGAPETWGTYCITELAPLFREAIALAAANNPAAASDAAPMTLAQSSPAPGSAAPTTAAPMSVRSQAPDSVNIKPSIPTPNPDPAPQPANIPLLKPLPPSLSAKPQETTDKITVFVARKIVTMDPGWPTATAVAVKDGRILSVGTFDDLKPWLRRYPYEVDRRFADKVIYPGFVEAHGHPVMGSVAISLPPLSFFPLRNPYGPDFPGVKTRAAAMAMLSKYVKEAKPNTTVLTWGYDVVAMGGDLLTRTDLDTISKTTPIVVWDASEHYVFANSAAIEKYGITNELVAKTIGAGKNPDGSSNGQFLGTEAAKIIVLKPLSEVLTPAEGRKRLRYLGALMQQAGITATGDLFYGGVNLELENMLTQGYFGQKDSIARIVHVADGATFQQLYGERAVEEVTKLRYTSNEHLIFNGVKFYADDAFVSFGMELQYPGYIDNDRFKGLFMYNSKEAFLDAMRPWWNAGFQIHVHSNGSGGNQITLDALAALQAETPRFDHRFSFEHFGISSTAQARQLKALGAVVSTNPYYVSERADLNADYIGTDRASLAARMSSILKENIVLSLHSDTPVGVPSPLYEVWTAVNRIGELSGKTHAPAERVRDVERAMKMVTIDAAYTLGVNDRIGSIEAGKYADFVVLDKDPQEVSRKTIKDIKVIATITGGRPMLTAQTRRPDW
jgi:predicted amidohydrolase YtcJ